MAEETESPPVEDKRLRHWIIMRGALAFARTVPHFGLETNQRFATMMGSLAAMLPMKRRRRTLKHIESAYPSPEYDDAFRKKLLVETYQAIGQTFLEALWASRWNPEVDDSRVTIDTPDNWEETLRLAKERKKGLIVFAAHHGSVELMARWFAPRCGMPVAAVAGRPKVNEMEDHMRRVRESGGYKLFYRGEAGLGAMRHLRAGGALVMLVDHNVEGEGVEVPFFGRGAHTMLAPARLALHSGAVANTMFCIRDGIGKFRVQCDKPMIFDAAVREPDARFRQESAVVVEYIQRIEAQIRKNPGQYLWMHRRWRKRDETVPLPT